MIVTFKPTKDVFLNYFETDVEKDKKKINDLCTAFLIIIFVLVSSLLELYDINFIEIINFFAVVVMPFVCIYLPMYFYAKISGRYLFLTLMSPLLIFNIFAVKELLN